MFVAGLVYDVHLVMDRTVDSVRFVSSFSTQASLVIPADRVTDIPRSFTAALVLTRSFFCHPETRTLNRFLEKKITLP